MKASILRLHFTMILPVFFMMHDSSATVYRGVPWQVNELLRPQWVLAGRDRPAKKKLVTAPSLSCYQTNKNPIL